MPSNYENLCSNIQNISNNCGFGNYYDLLDENGGYCFGLVHMWGRAVLLDDEKTYMRRLKVLTR